MNETLEQTAARDNTKKEIIEKLRKRQRDLFERYGTREDQMEKITTMIRTQLVKRHDTKQYNYQKYYEEEYAGSWFGLTTVSHETLDFHTRIFRTNYRMDDDLCEALRAPHGTTCHAVSINHNVIGFYIADFNRSLPELDEIRRHLDTVIPMQVMKNE